MDWALGVMNDGNVIADFDSDLVVPVSHSEVKVVAISAGRQVQGIDTRVTNMATSFDWSYFTTWCYSLKKDLNV